MLGNDYNLTPSQQEALDVMNAYVDEMFDLQEFPGTRPTDDPRVWTYAAPEDADG